MVAPRAQHQRNAIIKADLVLHIDAQLLLRFLGERTRGIVGLQRRIVDVVEVDRLEARGIALADLVPAVVDADEQLVLDVGARVEGELQVVVGREHVHPRVAGIGIEADRAAIAAVDRERIRRVRIAVGIVREVFDVAVDIARLEAEPHVVREVVRDAARDLRGMAVVTIPAGLADEGVHVELARRAGVRLEGADDRQELRGRAGLVFLVEPGQHDVGVGRRLPADRRRDHQAVVGHVLDERVGIARAADQAHGEIVRQRIVDVAHQLLAVIAAIDRTEFAARLEIGRLRHEVDEAADRTLAEQHRSRPAHDLDAREVVRIGCDAGIVREDVAHAVAELQRVEAADIEAVDAGVAAIGAGEDAGRVLDRVADADRTLRLIGFRRDHLDRLRQLDQRRVGLRTGEPGDDDGVLIAVSAGLFRPGGLRNEQRGYAREQNGPHLVFPSSNPAGPLNNCYEFTIAMKEIVALRYARAFRRRLPGRRAPPCASSRRRTVLPAQA